MKTLSSRAALATLALLALAGCSGRQDATPAPTASSPAVSASAEVSSSPSEATPSVTASSPTPSPTTPSATPSAAKADLAALASAPVPPRCDGAGGHLKDWVIYGSEGSPFEGALMHGQTLHAGNRTVPAPVAVDLDGDGSPELVSGYWCDNISGPFADALLVHDATGSRLLAQLDLAVVAPAAQLRSLTAGDGSVSLQTTSAGGSATRAARLVGGKLVLDAAASGSSSPSTASLVGVTVTGPADATKLTDVGLRTLALKRIQELAKYSSATGTSITVQAHDAAKGTATVKVTGVEGWRETWARGTDGTWKVTGRLG